jgi:hypothetical protein
MSGIWDRFLRGATDTKRARVRDEIKRSLMSPTGMAAGRMAERSVPVTDKPYTGETSVLPLRQEPYTGEWQFDPLAGLIGASARTMANAVTLPGDVYSGKTQMRTADGETNPEVIARSADLAGMVTLGAGAIPAEPSSLRSGLSGPVYHGSPQTDLDYLRPSDRGPLGPGVYATPTEQLAQSYARMGDGAGQVYEIAPDGLDVFRGAGHRSDDEYFGWKADRQRLVDTAAKHEKAADLVPMIENMWSGDGYPLYARIRSLLGGHEPAQQLFKDAGFHGLSGMVDGHEVVLFGGRPLIKE